MTADKTEMVLGETVEIQLTVDTTEPVTGSVTVECGKHKSTLYTRSGCGCTGGPIQDHESKILSYTPDKPGTYVVKASFKESDKIEFTVTDAEATTTSTTATPTKPATTEDNESTSLAVLALVVVLLAFVVPK